VILETSFFIPIIVGVCRIFPGGKIGRAKILEMSKYTDVGDVHKVKRNLYKK
jgi:hypothetical protein